MQVAIFLILLGSIIGLLIGSFLNVVIYRLPESMFREERDAVKEYLSNHEKSDLLEVSDDEESLNIVIPSSHCPVCKAPIKPWHNIPVVSYLMLKGRCANCATPISIRYPFVEILTGILTAFVAYQFGLNWTTLFVVVFTWSLIALSFIDIDHHLLPDSITLPLMWLGLILNVDSTFIDLSDSVYGAAFGYLSLWSVYWLFKFVTGKEGMGFGDFKLLAALGAWMGWQYLPLIIIMSSFVGAVIGVAGILIAGNDKDNQIPFGPYLAIAGWITFIWGEPLIDHYFQLFNVS